MEERKVYTYLLIMNDDEALAQYANHLDRVAFDCFRFNSSARAHTIMTDLLCVDSHIGPEEWNLSIQVDATRHFNRPRMMVGENLSITPIPNWDF